MELAGNFIVSSSSSVIIVIILAYYFARLFRASACLTFLRNALSQDSYRPFGGSFMFATLSHAIQCVMEKIKAEYILLAALIQFLRSCASVLKRLGTCMYEVFMLLY